MSAAGEIVLYNPHVDDFLGEPPHFRALGRRALKKYGFILQALHEAQGRVPVLVDGCVSAFLPSLYFNWLPAPVRRFIADLEFWLWRRRNDVPGLHKVRRTEESLGDSTLLAFSYKAAGRHPEQMETFSAFKHVVFHLSHYFVYTEEKAAFLRSLGNAWLAGDSDISRNEYFQNYFSWYKRAFLTLSFAVGARFIERKDWSQRDSRCVATGTVHDLRYEMPADAYHAYVTATGLTSYHPLRAALYEARETVTDFVRVKISMYRKYDAHQTRFRRLLSHLSVKQKSHFSYDIVDLYNEYKFAVVGEEAAGFPALGMLEAMACGCAVLADPRCLAGLGLEAGTHYVPHDGSLQGFLDALASARLNPEIEQVGKAGSFRVREEFDPASVGQRWVATIRSLQV